MAQYIDKDALIAEIKRILLIHTKRYEELAKHEVWVTAKEIEYRIQGLKEALSIINTLEVKEVELEKELDAMITPELKFHKALPSLFDVAKHFFELGMQQSKNHNNNEE